MTRVEHSGFPQRQVCAIRAALSTSIVLPAMCGYSWSPDPCPVLHWSCKCPLELCNAALVSGPLHRCPGSLVHVTRNEPFFPEKNMSSAWVVWGPSSPYWGPLGIHSPEQSILPRGLCMAVGMWQCPVFILLVCPPWDIQHFREHAQPSSP